MTFGLCSSTSSPVRTASRRGSLSIVPDDRFVASTLLLQSRHPGSCVYIVTSDLNLQTKLAVVGLPFVGPSRR